MATWKVVLTIATVVVAPLAASAEERVLILEPEKTHVTFTVKATGHDVDVMAASAAKFARFLAVSMRPRVLHNRSASCLGLGEDSRLHEAMIPAT